MREIVTSIGSLAMWWVVGYGIQAANRVLSRGIPDAEDEMDLERRNDERTEAPRLVA